MNAPRGGQRSADRSAVRVGHGRRLTYGDEDQDAPTLSPFPMGLVTARVSRGRVARLRERLGERDVAILASLARLRLLTGDQIRRLHRGHGSPVTQARRTRAQLQRLSELGLVVRLGRQVGGVRAGSSGFVYGLSGHGQAVLEVDGPVGGRRRRVWEVKPSFMDHLLCVAGLYVDLVDAHRTGSLELLDFQAEPPCWRRFPGIGGQTVTLKPDGFVSLGVGDMELSAFIEVDMGTESGPTIERKCNVYVAYWRSGIEQQRHGLFPLVLWLADTQRGNERIAEALRHVPADSQHLFHVALLDNAVTALTDVARGGRMA